MLHDGQSSTTVGAQAFDTGLLCAKLRISADGKYFGNAEQSGKMHAAL